MRTIKLMVAILAIALCGRPMPADAAGMIGADIGIMLPDDALDDFSDKGGFFSPYVAYMPTDYVGLMGRIELWAADGDERRGNDDGVGVVLGGLAGPRLALPIGPVELWGAFLGGVATSVADEILTDTSWAIAPGGGVNFFLNDHWFVGVSGHWHRLYQRVHGFDDATYTTAGIGFGYEWGLEEERMAMPDAPPAPPAMAEAPKPAPLVAKKKIVLRGVNFDFDKDVIRDDAKPVLDAAVQTLKDAGGVAVIAEGHTDAMGTDEYNQKLSTRRGTAVRNYLVSGGISASRIQVESFGESRPVATNDTEDGRAQNRRVELRVSEK